MSFAQGTFPAAQCPWRLFRRQGVDGPDDVAVVFGDGSTEVAAVAVLFTAFAVHARPADEDTDGNLEKISHFQEY